MSRYDQSEREEERLGAQQVPTARGGGGQTPPENRPDDRRDDQPHLATTLEISLSKDGLRLPRTDQRQPVRLQNRTYYLRASEADLLATIGAFRVVPAAELPDVRTPADMRTGDLGHLADQGLIERRQVVINEHPTTVIALTREGKTLLEADKEPRSGARAQAYHAGLVKPREIAHDAQLYRMYKLEAARIEAQGGTIRRVVLDYEMKREYHKFLNRPNRPEDASGEDERRAFALFAELPVVNGHLELPDLRIEYDTPEGLVAYRDVELVTPHYSRGQLAGKTAAGFSLYRASGSAARSAGATTGGTPMDPHHLDWLR